MVIWPLPHVAAAGLQPVHLGRRGARVNRAKFSTSEPTSRAAAAEQLRPGKSRGRAGTISYGEPMNRSATIVGSR
jgi:hypothetical protein